jgi:hypothetical protein
MDKVEKLDSRNVMIDGVGFVPASQKESEKCDRKSVQGFCRENRCWAAK